MFKIVSILSFVILISLSEGAVAQNDDHSVLWEISGNGLEKPSYVFGIINFLPKKDFSIPKEVKNSLKKCEVFATKMMVNNASKSKFNKAVKIPNDGWINDYLTDDELNKLRLLLLLDFEVKENTYHDFYSRLQPIILVTATTALYLEDDIVYMEDELSKMAKKNHMRFDELGSIQEEIDAFKKFPIADQVEALKYTVNNFYEHIEDYNQLVKYYVQDRDLESVKNETLKATNESQNFRKIYYDERLTHWLPGVKKMITNRSTFIAIGAPFLVGEQNLIKMLRNEGYDVKAIATSKD
jgi:uncharacterized protein YbaP (TraB family)